ncbi:MAG: MATE family efflux transporter [Lachnospiraceae bacterium]|nr:MATE family efflux transporter [Lachnospiraceae bacterium]
MNRSSQPDLLHGPLLKKIILFALPVAAGSMLQQLFNSVDIAVVGRFAGNDALGAVGANAQVIALFINLFVGASAGANVVVAHYIGSGERDRIGKAVHTSIMAACFAGIGIMLLCLGLAGPLLRLMNTPADILPLGILYLRVYAFSMPFVVLYNFGAAILRAIGDSRRPLMCLIISGAINAVLNLIFVIVFHMSVAGVALATVIAQIISCVMVFHFLKKAGDPVAVHVRLLKIDWAELAKVLKIGIPAGLQGTIFALANVCIQSSINSFGPDAVAGSAAGVNGEYFSFYLVMGFVQAAVTFVGQNYGAGKADRCRRVWLLCTLGGALSAFTFNGLILIFREAFCGLYTTDPVVLEYAVQRISLVLGLHFLVALYEVAGACLRGIGRSMTPTVICIVGTCVFRLLYLTFVMPVSHTLPTLYLVYPISWVITNVMTLTAYFLITRKTYARLEAV